MVEIVIDDTKKKAALVGDLHKNLVALSSAGGVCLPSAKLAIVHRRRGAIKFYTMAKETMALVSRWRLPFLN